MDGMISFYDKIFKFKDYIILYTANRYGCVYSQYIPGDVSV